MENDRALKEESEIMSDLIQELGWSRKSFARRIGKDVATVQRWCSPGGKPDSAAMAYLELANRLLNW